MTAIPLSEWSWQHQPGSSFRLDVLCFSLAFALHIPLAFITLDMKGKAIDRKKGERLVSVDLIDPDVVQKAPAPPPPVVKKSFFQKIKNLVKKEPPPPPKVEPKIEAKKIDLKPKEIRLDPKIKLAATDAPKLKNKEGFKTKNADKIKQKKVSLSKGGAGVTPLSVKKLGIEKDRNSALKGKSGFNVAKTEQISGIGGDGPGLSGATAPTIALKTSKSGSKEGFSKARIQPKTNKGRIGNVKGKDLGDGPKLGLKDSIIARDAKANEIGRTSRSVSRQTAAAQSTKKDAGRYQPGVTGGTVGGTGTQLGGSLGGSKTKINKPKAVPKKKKGPVITGPLKDRPRQKQILPDYPYWAQSQGIEATVILGFTVTPTGYVKDTVEVIRTSGYHKLDLEAIKALKKWKWIPITANREEVGQITFTYELE